MQLVTGFFIIKTSAALHEIKVASCACMWLRDFVLRVTIDNLKFSV